MDGSITEMVIWRLEEPVPGSPHRLKYGLFYGFRARILRRSASIFSTAKACASGFRGKSDVEPLRPKGLFRPGVPGFLRSSVGRRATASRSPIRG